MTAGGVVSAARRDDVFPAQARALGRGWVAWRRANWQFERSSIETASACGGGCSSGTPASAPRWCRYGSLSVAVDPVDADLAWPEGSRLRPDVAMALQAVFRDVQSLVRSRRELARLLMEPGDVRHGAVVVWLTAGSWPGRLAQALVIATDLGDQALATAIRDRIKIPGSRTVSYRPRHGPEVPQAERDRLDALYLDQGDVEQDVRRDAEHWLKQYAKALDRPIPL
jgi:hypothetical protein